MTLHPLPHISPWLSDRSHLRRPLSELAIIVTSEVGEWQFSLQQQTWILRSILLYNHGKRQELTLFMDG
jgi:hypothetical protein